MLHSWIRNHNSLLHCFSCRASWFISCPNLCRIALTKNCRPYIYILAIDKSYSFLLGHIGMIIILIIYVPWFLIYIIIASILLLLLAIPKKDPGYPTVVCCRMMLGHPAGTARVVPDWPWHSLRARAVPKKDTFFWTPNSQIAINIPDLTCFPLFSIVFLLYAICQILILVVFLWYGLIWEILLTMKYYLIW
jgi:hypothetical protein